VSCAGSGSGGALTTTSGSSAGSVLVVNPAGKEVECDNAPKVSGGDGHSKHQQKDSTDHGNSPSSTTTTVPTSTTTSSVSTSTTLGSGSSSSDN
ncbi:unnamed protein product, partial [Acidithrix sp. C25]